MDESKIQAFLTDLEEVIAEEDLETSRQGMVVILENIRGLREGNQEVYRQKLKTGELKEGENRRSPAKEEKELKLSAFKPLKLKPSETKLALRSFVITLVLCLVGLGVYFGYEGVKTVMFGDDVAQKNQSSGFTSGQPGSSFEQLAGRILADLKKQTQPPVPPPLSDLRFRVEAAPIYVKVGLDPKFSFFIHYIPTVFLSDEAEKGRFCGDWLRVQERLKDVLHVVHPDKVQASPQDLMWANAVATRALGKNLGVNSLSWVSFKIGEGTPKPTESACRLVPNA